MKYSEERRNNPEIRARVAEIHEDRKAMLDRAAAVLEDLVNEMRPLNRSEDDDIYTRCFEQVWRAYHRVSGDAHFMQKIGGETYTGNLAAGPLGAEVEKEFGR